MISARKTISIMAVIALTFTAIAFSYSGSYGVSAITLPVSSRCAELYDMLLFPAAKVRSSASRLKNFFAVSRCSAVGMIDKRFSNSLSAVSA